MSGSPDSRRPLSHRRHFPVRWILGGFFLLVLVEGLIEWTSLVGYDATFSELDAILQRNPEISVDEADRHVHGIPIRKDEVTNNQRLLSFQWPSLFSVYRLSIPIDADERGNRIEIHAADVAPRSPIPAPGRGVTRQLPKSGLSSEQSQTVSLNVNDVSASNGVANKGALVREIFRQGLLIAAREELGLLTLDPSIGETIPEPPSPQNFPFDLHVEISFSRSDKEKYEIGVELTRPNFEGKRATFNWTIPKFSVSHSIQIPHPLADEKNPLSPKFLVAEEIFFESLVERVEEMSRAEFVTALKEAGFEKAPPKPIAPADENQPTICPLDIVNQYALVRGLHSLMRTGKDSPETIGALICAYSNLGQLTDFHWNSVSKAFKARALLYAQRFLIKHGRSPLTLAHRAYARGFAGRHFAAMKDVREARTGSESSAPDWLNVIGAFCSYKTTVLDQAAEESDELATYLRMRLSDPEFNPEETIIAAQNFSDLTPACFQTAEILCETIALNVRRMAIEETFDTVWGNAYCQLAKIPSLPAEAKLLAERHCHSSDNTNGNVAKFEPKTEHSDEYRTRIKLIESMEQAGKTERATTEFSWTILAQLLREVSFVQAWRRLDVEANSLSVNSDQTIEEIKPLVEGHRLEEFVQSYASNSTEAIGHLIQLNVP